MNRKRNAVEELTARTNEGGFASGLSLGLAFFGVLIAVTFLIMLIRLALI